MNPTDRSVEERDGVREEEEEWRRIIGREGINSVRPWECCGGGYTTLAQY